MGQQAGLSVARLCELAGVPRATWYRRRLAARRPERSWPAAVRDRIEQPAAQLALEWPAWGHSGVVVDADEGLVLTNFHVIGTGGEVAAGRPDRLEDASVLAAAPCDDLALLEVDGLEGFETLPLGSQRSLGQGDQVVALGYPASASGGTSLTTTAGIVSAVRTSLKLRTPDSPRFANLVQTDAALNPGNSGGPLVGEDGRLVDVNTILFQGTTTAQVTDQGYAVGVDRIRTVLEELRDGRSIGWFGAGRWSRRPSSCASRGCPRASS